MKNIADFNLPRPFTIVKFTPDAAGYYQCSQKLMYLGINVTHGPKFVDLETFSWINPDIRDLNDIIEDILYYVDYTEIDQIMEDFGWSSLDAVELEPGLIVNVSPKGGETCHAVILAKNEDPVFPYVALDYKGKFHYIDAEGYHMNSSMSVGLLGKLYPCS